LGGIAHCVLFLYVGMDALDIEKLKFASDMSAKSVTNFLANSLAAKLPEMVLFYHSASVKTFAQGNNKLI